MVSARDASPRWTDRDDDLRSTIHASFGSRTLNPITDPTPFANSGDLERRSANAAKMAAAFGSGFDFGAEGSAVPFDPLVSRARKTAALAASGSIFLRKLNFCEAITLPVIF